METIDTFCKWLVVFSVFLMGFSFLYVFLEALLLSGPPAPPNTMFIALFGLYAAGMIYFAAHLWKGDL
jgi:hypothetical protein